MEQAVEIGDRVMCGLTGAMGYITGRGTLKLGRKTLDVWRFSIYYPREEEGFLEVGDPKIKVLGKGGK